MAGTVEATAPVPESQLSSIANEVCSNALGSATDYDHDKAEAWNHSIINDFLKALVSSPTSDDSSNPKRFKYAVQSTVIQHLDSPSTSSTGTSTGTDGSTTGKGDANGEVTQRPTSGRRGMHSATGAYWNNETDGIWTYKWDGVDKSGCDVVISVIWVLA